MKCVPPFTFAAVAQQVAERGWRPFPGLQTSKVPAMQEWSRLNKLEWDDADLVAAVAEYQPVDDYCCCLAVPAEIVAVDADIIDPEHAEYANELADNILGQTPLLRIGLAPKCIRVYRTGDLIKSRKLIRSKSSQAPANSSASAGTRKLADLTFGRTNLRSRSAPTATLSQS